MFLKDESQVDRQWLLSFNVMLKFTLKYDLVIKIKT